MAERNWYDDFMGFFGQDAKSVIEGRTPSAVTGKVEAGFGDWLTGRSQAELNAAYEQMQTTTRRRGGKSALQDSPYTATELGVDPENTSRNAVLSAVRNLQETKADEKSEKAFERSMAPIHAQNAITNKRLDNQMILQLKEMALSRENQANQLEYQKMRDRRADQEYNERMERLDRKDRQAMMQNLAAGLASLGAAFAL